MRYRGIFISDGWAILSTVSSHFQMPLLGKWSELDSSKKMSYGSLLAAVTAIAACLYLFSEVKRLEHSLMLEKACGKLETKIALSAVAGNTISKSSAVLERISGLNSFAYAFAMPLIQDNIQSLKEMGDKILPIRSDYLAKCGAERANRWAEENQDLINGVSTP
jgi:hypothetical protein